MAAGEPPDKQMDTENSLKETLSESYKQLRSDKEEYLVLYNHTGLEKQHYRTAARSPEKAVEDTVESVVKHVNDRQYARDNPVTLSAVNTTTRDITTYEAVCWKDERSSVPPLWPQQPKEKHRLQDRDTEDLDLAPYDSFWHSVPCDQYEDLLDTDINLEQDTVDVDRRGYSREVAEQLGEDYLRDRILIFDSEQYQAPLAENSFPLMEELLKELYGTATLDGIEPPLPASIDREPAPAGQEVTVSVDFAALGIDRDAILTAIEAADRERLKEGKELADLVTDYNELETGEFAPLIDNDPLVTVEAPPIKIRP